MAFCVALEKKYFLVSLKCKDDLIINDKARQKRRRNRTIDYHKLPSEERNSDLWCAKVAGYTQRAFGDADSQLKVKVDVKLKDNKI